jgi:hypothetical protein
MKGCAIEGARRGNWQRQEWMVGRQTAGVLAVLAMGALVAACGDSSTSYDLAAMDASYSGDMKSAIALARKEVARFSTPDQCSAAKNVNCGTLALAYGSLAQYQIAAGDRAAGEISFGNAKNAMSIMDREHLPVTAGVVYRDVSEAFWKTGDKARAKAVIEEGRLAGGDTWLVGASAAQAILEEKARARARAEADAANPAATAPLAPSPLAPSPLRPGRALPAGGPTKAPAS